MDNLADTMPFSRLMGVNVTHADRDLIKGELAVREDLCTTNGILHGGATMAFADALGAIGASLNLPEGAKGTTTIESKTNFLGAAPVGGIVRAESRPLSVGRRVTVWQTSIVREDGKPVSLTIQTQLFL